MQIAGRLYENNFPIYGNHYLWIRKYPDGNIHADVVGPCAIFSYLDMRDCYDACDEPENEVYFIRTDGKQPTRCELFGTWHNLGDPLRMEIRTVRGKTLDVGYGTDH